MTAEGQRSCFYVFEANGGWAIQQDRHPPVTYFPDFETALRGARDAAEATWLLKATHSHTWVGEPNSGLGFLDRIFAQ